jgi:Gpi18-like mannosyltransferase
LGIATHIPVAKLYAIKLISVVFDFSAAIFVYKLAQLKYKGNSLMPAFSFLAFLFAPTVFLNSSWWGQCDIIYTAFLIASLYYLLKDRRGLNAFWGMVFYGLAIAFKLQAIILLPLYLLLCLKKRISIYHFLLIPAAYLVTILPSLVAGRPFLDLVNIYRYQVDTYKLLTLSAPTIYQWFSVAESAFFTNPGILFALAVNFILTIAIYGYTRNSELNKEVIIKSAFLFSMLMPFLLPRMHERYFFIADVLAVVYAIYFPRYFFLAIAMNLISFFCYMSATTGLTVLPLQHLSLFVLALIVFVAYDLFSGLFAKPDPGA